jgi:predicted RNA-binding Zn ribbon-like protein
MAEGVSAEVELVLRFLNSMDVEEGTDEFRDLPAYVAWLRARDLRGEPTARDLVAARTLRAALRSAVGDPAEDSGEVAVPVRVGLDADGRPSLLAADPLGEVAAAAVALAVDGRWERVKICPADDCRWAFYDRSRNRSRHWCAMSACGTRAKSRAFRERQRG